MLSFSVQHIYMMIKKKLNGISYIFENKYLYFFVKEARRYNPFESECKDPIKKRGQPKKTKSPA